MIKKIYFVHDGRAMYPEINSTIELYRDRYVFEECPFDVAAAKPDIGQSIAWHMMGFYPKKLPAAITIHDYRSLSVGRGRKLKDLMKRYLNAKPDIRIIQPSIEKAVGIRDRVPTFLLDMGLTDSLMDMRNDSKVKKEYDFCYIGAMKQERRMELMVDSFLKRYGTSKTLLMVGQPEDYLLERYANNKNVVFSGKVPQADVFTFIRKSEAAVGYFPNHFPHLIQTPTKLLEYAALGARIIANEQPMNRAKATEYGIKALWGPEADMFANAPDRFDAWDDNSNTDPKPMLWSSLLERSGVGAFLNNPNDYLTV